MGVIRSGRRILRSRTALSESQRYDVAEYPSVLMHLKCDETSGIFIRDEVSGFKIQPGSAGSLAFGAPLHSVAVTTSGAFPLLDGAFPTIENDKIHLLILVFRSRLRDGLPSGSNSLNGEIAFGTRQGMHLTVQDAGPVHAVSASPDSTKQVTAGNDYVYVVFLRPAGQNYEHRIYNLDGTVATDSVSAFQLIQTAANTGMNDITPTPILGGVVIGEPQSSDYQKILYRFNTEPSAGEILDLVKWHGCAPLGIKAPAPWLRGKT